MERRGADIIIFGSRAAAECRERSLVLMAMNIDHVVRQHAGEWTLLVPEHQAPVALRELDDYAEETRDWPRRPSALPRHAFGLSGVAGCVAVLLLVTAASGHRTFGLDWFNAGRIDTDLIRQGEWWRTVTALTLHVGAGHLVGNLLLGSVFGLIAGHLLGHGLAWFSILFAGAVGNEISALVQISGHTAVGASTAVFAALGLLAAYAWRQRHKMKGRWAFRWAPIVVAAILLAYTGSGGARTDVIAHLAGFLAGIALGAYYGSLTPGIVLGARSQRLLGIGALAAVVVAWAIALGSHG